VFAARGVPEAEVRADSWVSLNGRPARPFVAPEVDLSKVRDAGPRWWVRR
jgi:hypothetical protein